jgi:signal transduction histidine kinase
MNLITNAIDAMEEQYWTQNASGDDLISPNVPTAAIEEIELNPSTIRLSTEVINSDTVVIRITDNGPGMTPQVKQRLFDPFFTTKPVGVGTGLGLSISYQIIVEKHGGQLHCFSEIGKGTEFVIQIPLRQLAEEPKAIAES